MKSEYISEKLIFEKISNKIKGEIFILSDNQFLKKTIFNIRSEYLLFFLILFRNLLNLKLIKNLNKRVFQNIFLN